MDARGLGLGGGGLDAEDLAYVRDQGFRAVINYRVEHPAPEDALTSLGLEYLYLPNSYAESETMPLEHVRQAVAFIDENLDAGRPVYVHCIGGWHRSAVGVVAYFMREHGWRAQQAWDHAASIRPGIEPRYMDVLYEYERELFGGEKLTLDLWTERWDVVPGETLRVTALVTHHGRPVEGATVDFGPDYGAHTKATTGADGRAGFTYTATDAGLMQYVHGTATKDGFVPGYDRNLYWAKVAKVAPATRFDLPATFTVRSHDGDVVIPVKVTRADGNTTNARVTITSRCGTHFRAYTGWDGKVDATFPAPGEGALTLHARVTRFPAEPVEDETVLHLGKGGKDAPCPRGVAPIFGEKAASGLDGRFSVPGPGALWTVVAALAVALALAGGRPRRPGGRVSPE